jgi:hypothetical protein
VLKGHTFKRGRVETRGRPQKLSAQALRKLDNVRKDLIKKAKGEAEVTRRQDIGIRKRNQNIALKDTGLRKTRCREDVEKTLHPEVHWQDILRVARVKVDPTTAATAMRRAGYDIEWRRPREKPMRPKEVLKDRAETCGRRPRDLQIT